MPTNAISVDNIKFKANDVWNGLDEVRLYNGTNALYCKEGVTTGLLMRDNQIQVVTVTWNPNTPGVPTVGDIKGYIDSAGDYHYTGNGTSANATSLNSLRESVSPRMLFNGSWAPNATQNLGTADSYQLYAVFSDGGATPMLGITTPMSGGGFYLRVDGGYGTADGNHTSYMAAFTISAAGVWTLLSCNYLGHTASGNHGGVHQVNVGKVLRLL